ncbi:acyltransferase family protein [Sphingobacterium corticibacterium]|uniref:Acyltransferase n=1 Tax=Sphingobacterium corticibacterium TaxID=2484746 RepID=A0A4Q6XXE6_9SPHI|nr:acyltransferase family protein [Sphingobacterium corticibacterium]RZF61669.1 acyltransferase [Sphingobacterium corticibacterium]
MEFRKDIQGLRAIAVLFVFVFHLSHSFLPGGFIGVDIFFVISGYLISKIIISKVATQDFNLLDFYIGRIKRIVPAYFFLLIVVWIAYFFIYLNADTGRFKLSHFWAMLFNSNYYFAGADNYFGASSNENPLLHTWTLGIEMQFYLFLPLILFIRHKKVLAVLLIAFIVALFSYSSYQIFFEGNKSTMYFSLLARTPEFLIGVLISVLNIEKKSFFVNNSFVLSVLGCVGLLISVMFYQDISPFPGVLAILPCISTAILLAVPSSRVNRILSHKALTYIGEISYSVYLWHWPIIAFFRYYHNRYDLTFVELFVIVILTIITSIGSYYLIERPLRSSGKLKFYLPLTLMAGINVLMIYFITPLKFSYSRIPLEYIFPTFGKDSHSNTFKSVGLYGDTAYAEKRILLIGDSHALTFVPYLDTLGKKESLLFRAITNDKYPALPGLSKKEISEGDRFAIYKQLELYIDNEVDSADVIIVCFAGKGTNLYPTIEGLLTRLKKNQKILFISDYPTLNINPVRINRSHVKDKTKNFDYIKTYTALDKRIHKLIQDNKNANMIDFSAYQSFFDDAPFYNDTLIYYDGGHLNYWGSVKYEEATGKEFMKSLNWALEDKD